MSRVAPSPPKHELVKQNSGGLQGTILDELATADDKFSADDASLLKFHGTYQQDDRDARKARAPGGGKAARKHSFMVRSTIPGGGLTAAQLLAQLDLCERFGNGDLRLTTRQAIQLHGIVKGDLQQTIAEINASLLTTLGACGDVVRNVMCCPAPIRNHVAHQQMQETAKELASHFAPRTAAYHTIWVDGEKQPDTLETEEPIYGQAYLPRKFKIGIALPTDNCTDVYTQDVGLLAVVEDEQVVGYNVLVGGGLGTTPSVKNTFPRLADPMAYVPRDEIAQVVTAIVGVQRDYGNRQNRRRARMKYLVDEWGVGHFKQMVQQYLGGVELAAPRSVSIQGVDDHLGWREQGDGRFYFGLYVENGRVKDDGQLRVKSGLRKLLERFGMPVRLTAQQSILFCDLDPAWREEFTALLEEHGLASDRDATTPLRRAAMACPALPTCGLAITESERVFPRVLDELEKELATLGLQTSEFTVRMTGCPNGCTRPYTADIGLVGKAVGKYTILLGGSALGHRLNSVYKDMVPLEDVVSELVPLLTQYKLGRRDGESPGDFFSRVGVEGLADG